MTDEPAAAIDRAKGGDPLAPVTVAVPSVFAGLALRRTLARRGGLVNVRFLVLARVAELLGAPPLAAAGRRPLTRARRVEAVRRALADDPGPFGAVAGHPATVRAVDRVLRELRRAGPADPATGSTGAAGSTTGHLGVLARRVRAATRGFYDQHEVLVSAAAVVRGHGTGEIGHVVLHLPRRVSAAEQTLLDALAGADALTVVHGATYEHGGGRAEPVATHVLVAPDPDVEVRAVVREIAARLHAGRSLHRMAVVYRSARPYRLLLHEHLAAAGIPHSGPAVRTLAQTAAGRLLLGLLRLPAVRFDRTAVFEWLHAAPVLETAQGDPAPAARWEAIARAANVVAGEAQWRDRLARYHWTLARRLERLGAEGEGPATGSGGDEDEDGPGRGLRLELDHVERLAAFVAELVDNASPPAPSPPSSRSGRVDRYRGTDSRGQNGSAPGRASWAGHVAWARTVLHRYLGGEGRRDLWPDDELEAARAVLAALDGLAELDDVSPGPDAAGFALVLEEQLRVPFGRHGRLGDGVFVGRVADVVGFDLDTVFVLGMVEGVFPERRRPDPLLPDDPGDAEEAARLRHAEDRRDYLWALESAPERVLSFARADDRGQRERLPSRWLLESASALAGRTLYADDLAAHPPAPWLTRVASFPALVAEASDERTAGSPQELRLGALLAWTAAGGRATDHPLVRAAPALLRGMEARAARRSWRFTRWDGDVGSMARDAGVLDRVQSPTGLQHWATCPRRFFLERVLDVAQTPAPEDALQLPPMEAGTLVHAALERFLAETAPRASPRQPWSEEERALLGVILDELFAEAEQRGLTGRPLLWRIQRRGLRRDVLGFADRDEQARARDGVVPVACEVGFGMHDSDAPPVEIVTAAGRKLAFRGKIDRVDRAPDGGRLVVLDYKTGSTFRYGGLAEDPVQAGRLLQLPVYALAARARFGEVPTEAAYWFVGERADYKRLPVALDERTTDRFLDVLDAVADGIEAGVFPANPGREDGRRGHEHCVVCPYDVVCPRDRRPAWDRIAQDPALAPYRRLSPERAGVEGHE